MSFGRIEAPFHLHTNSWEVIEAGIERGGEELLNTLARRLGRQNLAGLNILDVGCGVRLTQTIVNLEIPIGSYTGIEVNAAIVDWLTENVAAHDDRFKFVQWNVRHAYYNNVSTAPPMSNFESLPVPGVFDVITAFSVFTHLDPEGSRQLLHLMRKSLRPSGRLFFSALCYDLSVETFGQGEPDIPLAEAKYSRDYIAELLALEGFELISHEKPSFFIADSFLCGLTPPKLPSI
ncbi:MAG TPA: class I SAM-dependent methyltransferase [Chthoniobacterales bacterium]|nr:class I SAM-dependent methyltransferase [Chthoniobacterales bacterium]